MARNGGSKSRSSARERSLLGPGDLRWNCESVRLATKPPRPSQLLGQDRPVRALRTGLELYAPGFNIFTSGLLGSGRLRIVRNLLEELKPVCRLGPDRVYVHNFREPNKPRLVTLPRGRAAQFREDMLELGRSMRDALQQNLRSRWHRASRRLVLQGAEDRRNKLYEAVAREAQRDGCALVEYRDGAQVSADILPVFDGKPRALDEFAELVRNRLVPQRDYERALARREELIERLEQATERTRRVYRTTARELQRVDRRMADRSLVGLLDEFHRRWPSPQVRLQLDELRERAVATYEEWIAESDEGDDADEPGDHARTRASREPDASHGPAGERETIGGAHGSGLPEDHAAVLEVHIVQSDQGNDCPVIVESNPTYPNLFGTIEPVPSGEPEESGLRRIHPGALLRADGGYLILRANDLMAEPGAWRYLQRALKTGSLEVREFDPNSGATVGYLQPEPIPIDVKVVMIGEPGLYEHLCEIDPPFAQLFKIHAEFDSTVANNVANRRRYADFLRWLAEGESMAPFDPQAVAAIVEFGARLAGNRTRLSTCFGDLADVAREANHIAQRARGQMPLQVLRSHVEAALAAKLDRAELVREQTERDFAHGYVLLRTSGTAIGAVNALTVVEAQSIAFGKPVRVTATVGRARDGREGVLSIEREAEMTGPLHDKGILILEGFFQNRFGRERLVRFRATICFEQLYAGLDGDSASCAELVALLSSLSGIPAQQGIAVTGSLNQLGEVQAVGGVNEKIEGFFRLCQTHKNGGRREGGRGVVIPRSNVEDLMLDPQIVAAVSREEFAVYAVTTIEEVVEIVLGVPAAEVWDRVGAALDQLGGND